MLFSRERVQRISGGNGVSYMENIGIACILCGLFPVSGLSACVGYSEDSLIGVAILGAICGGLQLWARRVLGFGYPPHYPNASKTTDVFCTMDETGLYFSSPDRSVVYLPEVSWDEIKSYRLIGSTLFLTPYKWAVVLVALDMDGHTLEEWRDLVELMKAGNVSEI
ncbi:hypothetical protein [Faecalibaculum rodentium]|uniref:hypothetical protein n=1 Tax=Faecalibaculum rodentium TaxID=1702221 RepID=UPI00257047B0|nr:hypothetical protein [Faecalibaculum rodentium]